MRKKDFDADSLSDYDIERIADKIEDTGRIASAVHSEVSERLDSLRKLLELAIKHEVRTALKKENLDVCVDTVQKEASLKLIKYILEELENANQG